MDVPEIDSNNVENASQQSYMDFIVTSQYFQSQQSRGQSQSPGAITMDSEGGLPFLDFEDSVLIDPMDPDVNVNIIEDSYIYDYEDVDSIQQVNKCLFFILFNLL